MTTYYNGKGKKIENNKNIIRASSKGRHQTLSNSRPARKLEIFEKCIVQGCIIKYLTSRRRQRAGRAFDKFDNAFGIIKSGVI
jgi:hypothetical protein